MSLWQKPVCCCTWRHLMPVAIYSRSSSGWNLVSYNNYCLICIFVIFQLRFVLCFASICWWFSSHKVGASKDDHRVITADEIDECWFGQDLCMGLDVEYYFLTLQSVTRFVCHLREILIHIHSYLWPLYPLNRLMFWKFWVFNLVVCKLTWSIVIDQLTNCCHEQLGAPFYVREYLGKSGLVTAYKCFVRPMHEYSNVMFWELLFCTYTSTSWMQ